MTRLAAADAQSFWMSAKIPNDQFLLYAFRGTPDITAGMLDALHERAEDCADLRLRVVDDSALRYPRWVSGPVLPSQFVVHDDADLDWGGCLDAVAGLAADQLDARAASWRLHLFRAVTAAPTGDAEVTVAVLQMTHAIGDGRRSAQLAGWLFGRPEPVPPVAHLRRGNLVLRGITAARRERDLARDIEAGRVSAPPPPRPPLLTNTVPTGPRRIRTLTKHRGELARHSTVTVAALVSVGTALAGHLRARGVDPTLLGAEVPLGIPGVRHARNYFRNVGVGLHPDLPADVRAERIADALRAGRARAQHPSAQAAAESLASVPAPLLRWGVAQFDASVRSPAVSGNTVVSSVNRGPADLQLGAAPVVMTAGYPALSPMMGLTHGVHGIGDTIAVSVHAADSVMSEPELDDYVARLDQALSHP